MHKTTTYLLYTLTSKMTT